MLFKRLYQLLQTFDFSLITNQLGYEDYSGFCQ